MQTLFNNNLQEIIQKIYISNRNRKIKKVYAKNQKICKKNYDTNICLIQNIKRNILFQISMSIYEVDQFEFGNIAE